MVRGGRSCVAGGEYRYVSARAVDRYCFRKQQCGYDVAGGVAVERGGGGEQGDRGRGAELPVRGLPLRGDQLAGCVSAPTYFRKAVKKGEHDPAVELQVSEV